MPQSKRLLLLPPLFDLRRSPYRQACALALALLTLFCALMLLVVAALVLSCPLPWPAYPLAALFGAWMALALVLPWWR